MFTKTTAIIVCALILLAGASICQADLLQPGDANTDGLVDLKDATTMKANFGLTSGSEWGQGDFNDDDAVDLQDFWILKTNFGLGIGQPGSGTAGAALTLLIDLTTDDAWLRNDSGSALYIDGYEIWSVGGLLAPAGWQSIADAVVSDPIGVINTLGTGALSFIELTANANLLAEFTLAGQATLQTGASWYIGKPAPLVSLADMSFF